MEESTKYAVYADDIKVGEFDNEQDAEDFCKSVAGTIKNVVVQSDDEPAPAFQKATQ